MTTPALHVLIVEDDPEMLEVEAEALTSRGYRVTRASNGEEALRQIAEDEPQLVLLDMQMPVMDGWAFGKALRERYGRRIPIVVTTAAEDSRLRADEIGADATLGKPFDVQHLYEVVTDIVGGP